MCGGNDSYALYPTLDTASNIGHNVSSLYMLISSAYCVFLMALVALFNLFYVSYCMKEHQVPLIFRNPDSSIFYDTQRAKNLFHTVFIVLTGVVCNINFFKVDDKCLHTYDEDAVSSDFVDMYQYSLTALLWIVSLPMLILVFMVSMRDNLKFGCYPVVIANIIFAFMLLVLSQIVIINSIIYTQDIYLRYGHVALYGVLFVSMLNNSFYRLVFAQYDIAKEGDSSDFALEVNTPRTSAR